MKKIFKFVHNLKKFIRNKKITKINKLKLNYL